MADLYGQITKTEKVEPKQENNLYNLLLERIIDHEARPFSTALMFLNNKKELNKTGDWRNDKKYHARANAQAGQIYDPEGALGISFGREIWDLIRKNTWDRTPNTTFKDVWDDSKKDWEADSYGWMQGILHPLSDVDNTLDYQYLWNLNK